MTRHEIAARDRYGSELLIGYTPHKSRPGLLTAVQQRSREIILVLGTSESDEIIVEAQPPHCCQIGEWCIVFTGRTEARAKLDGELPALNEYCKYRARHRARRAEQIGRNARRRNFAPNLL